MSGNFIAVPLNTRFAMVRVESVAYSIDERYARNKASAAIWRGRVHIDNGLAPVELFIDRGKRRIGKIFALVAGQQTDAVRLERIEGVFDLLEASLHVRRRDDGK